MSDSRIHTSQGFGSTTVVFRCSSEHPPLGGGVLLGGEMAEWDSFGANPDVKMPFGSFNRVLSLTTTLPILEPGNCSAQREHTAAPKATLYFYLNGGSNHPQDSHNIYFPPNKFTHTHNLVWNHPCDCFISHAGNTDMTSTQATQQPPPTPLLTPTAWPLPPLRVEKQIWHLF